MIVYFFLILNIAIRCDSIFKNVTGNTSRNYTSNPQCITKYSSEVVAVREAILFCELYIFSCFCVISIISSFSIWTRAKSCLCICAYFININNSLQLLRFFHQLFLFFSIKI